VTCFAQTANRRAVATVTRQLYECRLGYRRRHWLKIFANCRT